MGFMRPDVGLRILVCGAIFSGCGPVLKQRDEVSSLHSDSGISRPSYDSIVNTFKGHEQKHGSLVEYFEYGRTYQDRPLMGIKVRNKDAAATGKIPAVLISEGIHGDEYLNVTDRLPGEFLDKNINGSFKKFLDKGGIVYFIPIINPDGFSSGRRENSKGADLNRDFSNPKANFTAFKQVETKSVAEFIAAEQKKHNFTLEASMEYHCCIGGLIHPNAYTRTPLPTADLSRHQEIGTIVKRLFKKNGQPYAVGTVHTMLQYPETLGGSDDYYFHTYGRRAFSFEGNFSVERQNLNLHVQMWNEIFEIAGAPYTNDGQTNPPGANVRPAFIAIGSANADGETDLFVSAGSDIQDIKLCLGTAAECSDDSAARLSLSLVKTEGTVKYYKTSNGVRLRSDADNAVTVTGQRAGQPTTLASVKISKK